ncbi:SNARE-associated protein Snapin [Armadillidium vulgare]|nr:SNARE-associated protein Snapin [Armadillidium vulgare]
MMKHLEMTNVEFSDNFEMKRLKILVGQNVKRNSRRGGLSQSELHQQLEGLSSQLTHIQNHAQCPLPLDSYIKKLQNAKRRVVVVNNILQNTQY